MTVIYELVGMWKEAVVAHFKVLCQHLSRGTEEGHDKRQSSWSFGISEVSK